MSTINPIPVNNNKRSIHIFRFTWNIKKSLYISFAIIPLSILLFYGIEDKNADYFKKGRFITNTEGWEYRYSGVIYPYGLMVNHWSVIVVVSIVGILISWIGHEIFKLVKYSITRPVIDNKEVTNASFGI